MRDELGLASEMPVGNLIFVQSLTSDSSLRKRNA